MQMQPSSTVLCKVAIHFTVFEKFQGLRLYTYISNYTFINTQNTDNLLLSNYAGNGVSQA